MVIPNVSQSKIIEALAFFDRKLSNTWKWEQDSTHNKYCIHYRGKFYPVNPIVTFATKATDPFDIIEASAYLEQRGFNVSRINNSISDKPKTTINQDSKLTPPAPEPAINQGGKLTPPASELTINQDGKLAPPLPLDGPAFVIMYRHEDTPWKQLERYGRSYSFNASSSGDSRKLIDALQEFRRRGTNVYFIIYRAGPDYAFTAWAKAAKASSERSDKDYEICWQVTLEQQEFSVPLYLKSNAKDLNNKISWLSGGLRKAFQFRSIRKVETADFQTIIKKAQETKSIYRFGKDR
ncbi:MAG: hypothetical protein WCS37_18630 [Chloroflexota bacterium]|nr:hypothetical protein [Chloroflexota bacterium]